MAARRDIVIVGAGAIGRGFLPWVIDGTSHDLIFVDSAERIVEPMKERGCFRSYRVREAELESRMFPVKAAWLPEEFDSRRHQPAAVFVNVGPRQVPHVLGLLRGIDCPIILCENDPATVAVVRSSVRDATALFAVPDVIASNTAPEHLLAVDPLSAVTEQGDLFIDDRAKDSLEGDVQWLSEAQLLSQQWTAKLYLHNTPHCATAYLGAFVGARYVHEAMAVPDIAEIVAGCMDEMLIALKLRWEISHKFLDWYAAKELRRFSNPLLFDPVSRVAREPLRKLDPEGRLIGAAQVCLSSGFVPHNLLVGIAGALLFRDRDDSDRHLDFMRRALPPDFFLTHVLNLRRGEPLEMILRDRMPKLVERIRSLPTLREHA